MIDFIFVVAELIIIISYLCRDIFYLHIVSIIGLAGYVLGGFVAGVNAVGMKAIIIVNAIAMFINMMQVWRILVERIPFLLPEELKNIYASNFYMITTKEFNKIYEMGHKWYYPQGQALLAGEAAVSDLILIISGSANVIKGGNVISVLEAGFFIGETSFLQQEQTTTTIVVASEDFACLVWNKQKLYALKESDEKLYLGLNQAIAINLLRKLNVTTNPHEPVCAELPVGSLSKSLVPSTVETVQRGE